MVQVEDTHDKNGEFDELYQMFYDDFGVDKSTDPITFRNAHYYVDDYLEADKLGVDMDKDFEDPVKAKELMKKYKNAYLYEGLVGANQVARVASSNFNEMLVTESYLKKQAIEGKNDDKMRENLKHIHWFVH